MNNPDCRPAVARKDDVQNPTLLSSRHGPLLLHNPIHVIRITHGGDVQTRKTLVALNLRVIYYATPHIGHRRVIQLRDPTHIHRARSVIQLRNHGNMQQSHARLCST